MSTERLRRACMGSSLFAQLLETHSDLSSEDPPIIPRSNTYLTRGDSDRGMHFDKVFLVPGGRFLVQTRRGHLEIWDLGPLDAPALGDPVLLCQSTAEPQAVTHRITTDTLAVRMVDEETLRIAVGSGYTTLVPLFLAPLVVVLTLWLRCVR